MDIFLTKKIDIQFLACLFLYKESGNDLLFRDPAVQVPSALKGLTSEFGMGSGVTPTV